tara:strand:+ start:4499 stop:4735 length:237 start_codon:yes stop_codon:yes gene_type:complete
MNTIQLQSIGKVEAKKSIDFKVGEKMKWNFGYTSEILEIVKETKTQIVFKLNSIDPTGKISDFIGERRLKKERLVAIG